MKTNNKTRIIKLAHIVTAFQSVVTIMDSKLRALQALKDLEVSIISAPPDGSVTGEAAIRHVPVAMERTIKPLADLKSIWAMYHVFKKERFDVIHSHTAKAGVISAVAGCLARVPLRCHTYHGLPFYNGQRSGSFNTYYFLEKLACSCRHHVFMQNKRDLMTFRALMGDQPKSSFEGNGIDLPSIKYKARQQIQPAEALYPGEGLKLLMVSRLEPVKRVDDFFRVVQLLKNLGMKISAVVAGEGHLKRQFCDDLKKLALDDCLRLVGFTQLIYGLIAASDIVVLCSEKEGIPRAIMEAMALSRPVIATDVAGTQEVVVNNCTGYLVPLGDVEQMVHRIMQLAIAPDLRLTMGREGCRRVKEHYDDNQIALMMHDFYRTRA